MIVLGLTLTAVFGWLLLPRRWEAHPLEGLALGFLLASFGISVEVFFLEVAGIPWSGWIALLPWAAAAGWAVARRRPRLGGFYPPALAPIAAVAAALAVWLPYERAMPLTSQSWDAWAIWLFKAKAFYLDGALTPYLSRAGEFVGQPGYPLLTPLYSTFLYSLAGGVDDLGAKLTSPCFFLALVGAFHFLARRLSDCRTAALTSAMLALTPLLQTIAFDLAGYADTALSAYIVCAAGFAYLAMRDGGQADVIAASLAATAAAWTKNEGQFFLLGLGAAMALWLLLRRRPAVEWAALAAPPALLLGAWSLLRSGQSVEAAGFRLGLDFQFGLFTTALHSMLRKAFTFSHFNLAFLLLPAGAAVGATFARSRLFWLIPGLAVWQFAGALLAYSTGRNDLAWWLETSADRLLSQIAPLCLLTAAAAFDAWLQAEPAAEATAAPPKKRRKRMS
jgi:hypothetical protein